MATLPPKLVSGFSRPLQQWHFGVKMHIVVDDVTGIIHSEDATPANDYDVTATERVRHS
ncbi:transposase [Microbulbifer sp. ZKSA004]|uniref:transposase n=1 Tax=Microbulbifer sp. ZKSA004 TaxID=3243389 RepID=UPI0040399E7A